MLVAGDGRSDEKIRVLRIFSRLNVGGPSIHVVLLTAGLDPARYETTLVVGREGEREGNLLDLARAKNVDAVTVATLGRSIRPFDDLRSLVALCRLMSRERPHVVHTHTAKAGALGRIAALVSGAPVVVHTFHGSVFSGYFGPVASRVYAFVERGLARITDAVIGVSPAVSDELARERLRPRHGIHTIPLGLELERFAKAPRAGTLRERLGIPANAPLVGCVGRLAPIKDVPTLIAALERIEDARLVLVGDGPERKRLEELVRKRSLSPRVHFVGFLSNLESVYPAFDVVVNCSRNEGTPVALIEAMAAGVPVVATAVGGSPDLLRHGALGTLTPPADPEALAREISRILTQPDSARVRAAHARHAVLESFGSRRLFNDIERLYLQLLRFKGVRALTPSYLPTRN